MQEAPAADTNLPKELTLAEKQMVFEDTHPTIIDRSTWEIVRKMRQGKRRSPRYGQQGLFTGTLFCGDCGGKLYFNTRKKKDGFDKSYLCSEYKKIHGKCTAHYISENALANAVLAHLRLLISVAVADEREFAQSMMDESKQKSERGLAEKKKTLKKHGQRIQEIDALFERLYEDNVTGKITDERFSKMSAKFEQEQTGLKEIVAALEKEIAEQESRTGDIDRFIALAREKMELRELTPGIVNLFIKRIDVYEPENPQSKKNRNQPIEIHYNFIDPIGEVEVQRGA